MYDRNGNVVAQQVTDVSNKTLYPIIRANIPRYSVVYTDDFRGYNGLKYSWNHFSVNHSAKEYVNGMAHTNNLECFWSHLKRGVDGIYHWVSVKHLQGYVDEYALRFNTRKTSTNERFNLILDNMMGRLTYKQLIANE